MYFPLTGILLARPFRNKRDYTQTAARPNIVIIFGLHCTGYEAFGASEHHFKAWTLNQDGKKTLDLW
jgi:hypothetical protein